MFNSNYKNIESIHFSVGIKRLKRRYMTLKRKNTRKKTKKTFKSKELNNPSVKEWDEDHIS